MPAGTQVTLHNALGGIFLYNNTHMYFSNALVIVNQYGFYNKVYMAFKENLSPPASHNIT
jgi:hypothetical protein